MSYISIPQWFRLSIPGNKRLRTPPRSYYSNHSQTPRSLPTHSSPFRWFLPKYSICAIRGWWFYHWRFPDTSVQIFCWILFPDTYRKCASIPHLNRRHQIPGKPTAIILGVSPKAGVIVDLWIGVDTLWPRHLGKVLFTKTANWRKRLACASHLPASTGDSLKH